MAQGVGAVWPVPHLLSLRLENHLIFLALKSFTQHPCCVIFQFQIQPPPWISIHCFLPLHTFRRDHTVCNQHLRTTSKDPHQAGTAYFRQKLQIAILGETKIVRVVRMNSLDKKRGKIFRTAVREVATDHHARNAEDRERTTMAKWKNFPQMFV